MKLWSRSPQNQTSEATMLTVRDGPDWSLESICWALFALEPPSEPNMLAVEINISFWCSGLSLVLFQFLACVSFLGICIVFLVNVLVFVSGWCLLSWSLSCLGLLLVSVSQWSWLLAFLGLWNITVAVVIVLFSGLRFLSWSIACVYGHLSALSPWLQMCLFVQSLSCVSGLCLVSWSWKMLVSMILVYTFCLWLVLFFTSHKVFNQFVSYYPEKVPLRFLCEDHIHAPEHPQATSGPYICVCVSTILIFILFWVSTAFKSTLFSTWS